MPFVTIKSVEGYRSAGPNRVPDYVSIKMKERITLRGKEEYLLIVKESGNKVLSYQDSHRYDVLNQFLDRIELYKERGYQVEWLFP